MAAAISAPMSLDREAHPPRARAAASRTVTAPVFVCSSGKGVLSRKIRPIANAISYYISCCAWASPEGLITIPVRFDPFAPLDIRLPIAVLRSEEAQHLHRVAV